MIRHPCCEDCQAHGDRPQGFELPAGDMDQIRTALLSPSDPCGVERVAAGWRAVVAAERGAA